MNVFAEDGAISRVEFSNNPCEEHIDAQVTKKAREDLRNYLQGYKIDFKEYEVKLEVTSFCEKVLQEVRNIPYGETMTYGEVASRLNSGPRAVGQAVKRNPVPIIIPCHRVVASNGWGGFSSGVDIKKELLNLESDQID